MTIDDFLSLCVGFVLAVAVGASFALAVFDVYQRWMS